jgi:predicted nucleic acid-binding Zn ribbon protein
MAKPKADAPKHTPAAADPICVVCGAPIVHAGMGRKPKTCSVECKKALAKRNRDEKKEQE